MAKNKGNNGVVRVRYTEDTQWARDTGRYLKEGVLIEEACSRQDLIDDDDLTVPYVTVRFDGESNNANVTAYFLELI